MALSEEQVRRSLSRLLLSRMRLLCSHGFYGLLLMHMTYAIDEALETAATDGVRILFGVDFLESLTDAELDFVMMHELLHVVLQHCLRGGARDSECFNIACDIVVNSNILLEHQMDRQSITLKKYGESIHLTPDGKEGYAYTAEQVYEMLMQQKARNIAQGWPGRKLRSTASRQRWDDHSSWGRHADENAIRSVWAARMEDACAAISVRDPLNTRGLLPLFAQRLRKEWRDPQTDWRSILNDFVQEEVTDYSFLPPDRRFENSPFFLPDFNGKEDRAEDILFMTDSSASMSDAMIAAAYAEVKGAIDQFDGRLKGWLGFFDAAVTAPKPFADEAEFRMIHPAGGGGTDFRSIFDYVTQRMDDKPPASIIILTDGFAPFPEESLAGGIPVLWLLNNEDAEPPWGKTARITV